ncbi:DUF5384 family protein [Escherichia coli]
MSSEKNDFIEQELKERAAKTDVIQSEADANRNISTGSKDLLQKRREKAREKKAMQLVVVITTIASILSSNDNS